MLRQRGQMVGRGRGCKKEANTGPPIRISAPIISHDQASSFEPYFKLPSFLIEAVSYKLTEIISYYTRDS